VIDFPHNITAGETYSGSCTSSGMKIDVEENCIEDKVTYAEHSVNFTLRWLTKITCHSSKDKGKLLFNGK